jgi:hypothetical protein
LHVFYLYQSEDVLVQKHSKPGVIVMSEREYENLRYPRKRFSSQAEWDKFFVKLDTIKAGMSEKDREELLKILPEEIKAVRALQ